MKNNVHLGDGVIDSAKTEANSRMQKMVKILIDTAFDYFDGKVQELPESISNIRNNPKIEQDIVDLWSKELAKEDLIPRGYQGLSNSDLVSNMHQDGYLDGMYVGYILAMMALVENDAPKELILSVRDSIRPDLIGHHYDDRDEFVSKYKDEKYSWIN